MSETKVDRAMALIKKLGRARSDEIAEHLEIPIGNVVPLLQDRLRSGALVSCKVERPGKPPVSEFRLSASGPTGRRPEDFGKAVTSKVAIPPRPAKATSEAKTPTVPAPSTPVHGAPEHGIKLDAAHRVTRDTLLGSGYGAAQIPVDKPIRFGIGRSIAIQIGRASTVSASTARRFRISDDAELTVEQGGQEVLRMPRDDTRRLYNFLRGFLPDPDQAAGV